MNGFKPALGKFLTGEIEFAQLQAELDIELASNPAGAAELLQLIKNLYGAGRLPFQLHELLVQRILQTQGASPAGQPAWQTGPQSQPAGVPGQTPTARDQAQGLPPQGMPGAPPPGPASPPEGDDDEGRTRLRVTPGAPPPAEDDTSTRLRGAPRAPADQTSPTGVTGRTGQTSPTGQSWQPPPGQTAPTGATGQSWQQAPTGHTSPTGASPSSWQQQTGQTGVTGQTGITGQTGQTGLTGQTGVTGQTGQSGISGSSWAHPEQWTDAGGGGVPTVGSMIKGRFVLESIIGHGGMGIVFKARDLRKEEAQDRNPYIAVKILNEEFKKHPESLKALQRESRKAQDLAHPNIVTVFDFDRDGGNVFMTMEFLEGESLDRFLKRYRSRGLPVDRALPLIRDMANGLAYAHDRGIVHSDFKPANAFLTKNGVVKIFDFGIARAAKHSDDAGGEKTLFDAGSLGALTPAYATITMIEGGDPDVRDDIYALGCVAYELFTGEHPFGKRSAMKARNAGMEPKQIAGLNRRQWRIIQKSLAFERKDQPATVLDFMDGLEPKKINKGQVIGFGVAAVVVIGFLISWVPGFLEQRHLNELVAIIESGNDADIALILDELQFELSPEAQLTVYGTDGPTRTALFNYFDRAIANAFDPDRGLFDFTTADALRQRMNGLFPDSLAAGTISAQLDELKNQQLQLQAGRFESALSSNTLLIAQGAGSVEEILAIVAAIDPAEPMLTDSRLPPAYAVQARAALDSDDVQVAQQLLNAGLAINPNDPSLIDVSDAVNSAVAAFEASQRVAALEGRLASLSAASSIGEFRQAMNDIAELSQISPDNAAALNAAAALQTVLAARVVELNGERNFAAAELEVNSFAEVASGAFVADQLRSIQQAETAFNTTIQNSLGEIQQLAQTGGFNPPNEARADERLQALADLGADVGTLEAARQSVLQGYLQSARAARSGGDFDGARALANIGLARNPDQTMEEFLRQELVDIDSAESNALLAQDTAERQRLEAERAAEIETLEREFQTALAAAGFSLDDGRRLANTVDRLRGLGAQSEVTTDGRARIAAALQRQAESLRDAGRWDEARALAAGSQNLLPEIREAGLFAANLESEFRQFQLNEAAADRAEARDEYNRLLAQTNVDRAWLDAVWRARSGMATDAAFIQASDQEIAGKLAGQVASLAGSNRFSAARQLLQRGSQLLPGNDALIAANVTLQEAEAAFAEVRAEQEREAELQARVDAVRRDVRANDIDGAVATFNALRGDLPASHEIFAEAPILFADKLIENATALEREQEYDSALTLLDRADQIGPPAYSRVDETRQRILLAMAAPPPPVADPTREIADPVPDSGPAPVVAPRPAPRAEPAGGATADTGPSEDLFRQQQVQRANQLEETARQTLDSLTALNVGALTADMDSLNSLDPDGYTGRRRSLAATGLLRLQSIDNRIEAMRRKNALKALFPENPGISDHVLPPPDEDRCSNPAFAGRGSDRRAVCRDPLFNEREGPRMVVIPAGGPLANNIAISKYEITISDYNVYCELSGGCRARDETAALPLTNISLAEMQAYALWLSETTGFEYRLPTSQEWLYAADAAGSGSGLTNYNCKLGGGTGKGDALVSVATGDPNAWGLQNVVGNAQELVVGPGGAAVRGGSINDAYATCSISLEAPHSGQPDAVTSFRLVRPIGDAS